MKIKNGDTESKDHFSKMNLKKTNQFKREF